jgi:hypothetical protein
MPARAAKNLSRHEDEESGGQREGPRPIYAKRWWQELNSLILVFAGIQA